MLLLMMIEHPPATPLVILAPEELAYPDAGRFGAHLTELPPEGELVIDLRNLGFLDSCGLRTLLVERRRRQAAGGTIAVSNASAHVRRLLQITGLHDALPLV
jgi:anti-anti-sigma factor